MSPERKETIEETLQEVGRDSVKPPRVGIGRTGDRTDSSRVGQAPLLGLGFLGGC